MTTTLRSAAYVAATLTILTAFTLRAGEIKSFIWYPGVTSVAGTAIDPAPTANDDVVGTSPYEIFVTQKDYSAVGPVDIEFFVEDNGGVTEYVFKEGVNNSTGIDWTGYHVELGFGNGADFVKSTAGDELDFDTPDENSLVDFDPGSLFFPTWVRTEDDIVASGGVMANGGFAGYFFFHVDVPDGITSFTLRQSPIADSIPEPSAIGLAILGVIGLGAGLRRFPGH